MLEALGQFHHRHHLRRYPLRRRVVLLRRLPPARLRRSHPRVHQERAHPPAPGCRRHPAHPRQHRQRHPHAGVHRAQPPRSRPSTSSRSSSDDRPRHQCAAADRDYFTRPAPGVPTMNDSDLPLPATARVARCGSLCPTTISATPPSPGSSNSLPARRRHRNRLLQPLAALLGQPTRIRPIPRSCVTPTSHPARLLR